MFKKMQIQRPMALFVCSFVTFLLTLVIGFIAFSSILRAMVHDQKSLKDGNEVKEYYIKVPFPFEFRVYFFNITNPEEASKGETPILKEVGPYVYDAYKEKIDVHESKSEDSITYIPHELYFYNDKMTSPLSQNDYVTILNPLIVGMANFVAKDYPALLPVLNKAIGPLFGNPKSVYLTGKVRDILFDGLLINCTSNDFASKAVCGQMRNVLPSFKEPQKNIFLFGLFGSKNGTLPIKLKVSRGIHDIKSLGRLLELNDEKTQNIWLTRKCNRFDGSDGWIFPPYLHRDVPIKVYSTDLCRNMLVYYVEDVKYHSVKGWLYHINLGDQSSVPEDKCYCPSTKTCLKKGILDLSKCMGLPVLASLPHFLYSDPSYLSKVKGLKPEVNEHINKIIFEPMTATPLLAHKRLQINVVTQSMSKITLLKRMPSTLHPILWIDESTALEGKYLKKVSNVFLLLKVGLIFKSFVLILSIAGMGGAGYMHYQNKQKQAIKPTEEAEKEEEEGKEVEKAEDGEIRGGWAGRVNEWEEEFEETESTKDFWANNNNSENDENRNGIKNTGISTTIRRVNRNEETEDSFRQNSVSSSKVGKELTENEITNVPSANSGSSRKTENSDKSKKNSSASNRSSRDEDNLEANIIHVSPVNSAPSTKSANQNGSEKQNSSGSQNSSKSQNGSTRETSANKSIISNNLPKDNPEITNMNNTPLGSTKENQEGPNEDSFEKNSAISSSSEIKNVINVSPASSAISSNQKENEDIRKISSAVSSTNKSNREIDAMQNAGTLSPSNNGTNKSKESSAKSNNSYDQNGSKRNSAPKSTRNDGKIDEPIAKLTSKSPNSNQSKSRKNSSNANKDNSGDISKKNSAELDKEVEFFKTPVNSATKNSAENLSRQSSNTNRIMSSNAQEMTGKSPNNSAKQSRESSVGYNSLNSLDKEMDEINKVFVTLVNNATSNNQIEDQKNGRKNSVTDSVGSNNSFERIQEMNTKNASLAQSANQGPNQDKSKRSSLASSRASNYGTDKNPQENVGQ